jgi:hypothetical protein
MRGLVGRDFSTFERRRTPRVLLPALIALFISAFALVALRTEVLKLRYELADQLERESALDAQQRDLTVRMRQLREPRQLAERAAELGFGLPDRVIDLSEGPNDPAARLARAEDSAELQP